MNIAQALQHGLGVKTIAPRRWLYVCPECACEFTAPGNAVGQPTRCVCSHDEPIEPVENPEWTNWNAKVSRMTFQIPEAAE
jgi:hypothetical protein